MIEAWARQLPILVELATFLGALGVVFLGARYRGLCRPLTLLALALSVGFAGALAWRVAGGGAISYRLGGWPPPFGIEYVVDPLNAAVLVLIPVAAFLAAWACGPLLERELPGREPPFYALFLLAVTGLSGMTVTGDAFNLYVLMEVASLSTYALVGLARGRAALAGFNYLILGTIGASLYLLGVGFLYVKTGTLNMADLARLLPELRDTPSVKAGFLLILVGSWLKMGFFPLHGWLPAAYAHAPNAAVALMAPLVTKVWIYVMARMMLSVFTPEYAFGAMDWSASVPTLAAAAILFGSYRALRQSELRRIFGYLVIAEVGYMVGGAWLGNRSGLTGALFHMLVDGLMTLCLFLTAAAMVHAGLPATRAGMRGLYRRMPFTMAAFTVAGLSMIGLPPLGGFFSKWYLLSGAWEARNFAFLAALLLSSLANAFIFFRLFEKAYFEPWQDGDYHDPIPPAASHGHDPHVNLEREAAPWSLRGPLLAAAAGVAALGPFSFVVIGSLLRHAVPEAWP